MAATLDPTTLELDRVPRRRWAITCLLGFGVLVNYFDRVNLSVSKEALDAAFGISAVTFGYLSSAYNWTYAALQLPSGLLLDKFEFDGSAASARFSGASLPLARRYPRE